VSTEHNTVFARSGQLSVHKLFTSCIRRCLVSRACDWVSVMSALSAALLIFSFQLSLLFFHHYWSPGSTTTATYYWFWYAISGIGMRSIAISVCLCLFVCLFVCLLAHLKNHTSKFHWISVHVICSRSSLLLWWQCNTLCTSGFVDDVMFSHNGESGSESKPTFMFSRVRQVAASVAKSAVSDYILFQGAILR